MATSIWSNLMQGLGLASRPAKRRPVRLAVRCHAAGEFLEDRALLSAKCMADPVAVDVEAFEKAAKHAGKAVSFPNIGGVWALTTTSTFGSLTGDLTITQDPPDSRKFTGNFQSSLATLTLKGKFKGEADAAGKAVITLAGQKPVKAKFTVVFENDFTTFSGQATAKNFPNVGLEGARDLP